MNTLYEINRELENVINQMFLEVDEETGEIPEDIMQKIEDLQIMKDEKLESIGVIIKSKKAFMDALKNEKANLDKGIRGCDREIEWLEGYVANILDGEKWKSTKVAYSFRKSAKVIIDDESLIPNQFIKEKIERSPDKTAIKKAIDEGVEVSGTHIEISNNLQVK